jgi:hypothetical protein
MAFVGEMTGEDGDADGAREPSRETSLLLKLNCRAVDGDSA